MFAFSRFTLRRVCLTSKSSWALKCCRSGILSVLAPGMSYQTYYGFLRVGISTQDSIVMVTLVVVEPYKLVPQAMEGRMIFLMPVMVRWTVTSRYSTFLIATQTSSGVGVTTTGYLLSVFVQPSPLLSSTHWLLPGQLAPHPSPSGLCSVFLAAIAFFTSSFASLSLHSASSLAALAFFTSPASFFDWPSPLSSPG